MPGCAENHRRHLLFEGDLKLKEGTASKVRTGNRDGSAAF